MLKINLKGSIYTYNVLNKFYTVPFSNAKAK